MSDPYTYWIREPGDERGTRVTRAEFIARERAAGFNAPEGVVATHSFKALDGTWGYVSLAHDDAREDR